MDEWQESLYGSRFAADYDLRAFGGPPDSDTQEAVTFLSGLLPGPGGRLLELGSGTGRLLVPLAERAFDVQGVELSPEMVARMRDKPGAEGIPVLVGDMSAFSLEARFDIVLLAYNTLFSLLTR